MTGLTIRPYTPADADACARIFDRAWHAGHPYAPRVVGVAELAAETRDETILVAETAEEGVVGFVALYEPAHFVHHLYVDPALHGRGIGKALLSRAVALAGGSASLKCQTRNPQALAFYRRLGWTPGEEGGPAESPWVRLHSP
jgi:GNAT superfamily N-acetyltransferase